jgi:glycosyltransferase involved in cell wall biosynthesis
MKVDRTKGYFLKHMTYVMPPIFNKIPTEDSTEALHFCKALNALVNGDQTTEILRPELSLVIPVYNEQDNLHLLYQRLCASLEPINTSFEIVFINDGSRDDSASILEALATKDRRICVIDLSRNFGHQVAISAGLDYANGRGVIIMDADLQDPPEVLPEFIDKWREGYDVVYAIRAKRRENWLKRGSYALFYRLLHRIANIEIPLDAGDFCIMDRKVVDSLNGMPERSRFVRGLRSWIGLRQTGLAYERQTRHSGQPKYTITRLIYLALDGLISFSFLPLRLITLLGFGVSILSILLAIGYMIQKLTFGLSPTGFTTTIVAILFLAGVQLITIGVIGEYVGRIFEEVKQRPLYVVRRIYQNTSE